MRRVLLILLITLIARDAAASKYFLEAPHSLELWTIAYPHVFVCRVEEVSVYDGETSQVIEVLKGPPPPVTRFRRRLWCRADVGDHVIIFADDAELQPEATSFGGVLNPRSDEAPIMSFELRPLTNMREITKVIRDAVAFEGRTLRKPPVCEAWAYRLYIPDWHLFPNLPVDSRLEAHARQWVRSPKPAVRAVGAYALSYFKSDQNIRILQELLDDPGTLPGLPDRYGAVSTAPEYFPVRIMAMDVLRKWGIPVRQPEVERPGVFRRAVREFPLAFGIVGLSSILPPALYILVRRRRKKGLHRERLSLMRLLLDAAVLMSFLVAVVLAILCFDVRARRYVVTVVDSDRGRQLQLATHDGWLQFHSEPTRWPHNHVRHEPTWNVPRQPWTQKQHVKWDAFGRSFMESQENQWTFTTRLPELILLTSLLPLAWLYRQRRFHRRRRRARDGLCLDCGYDLRASPDRCPECGAGYQRADQRA